MWLDGLEVEEGRGREDGRGSEGEERKAVLVLRIDRRSRTNARDHSARASLGSLIGACHRVVSHRALSLRLASSLYKQRSHIFPPLEKKKANRQTRQVELRKWRPTFFLSRRRHRRSSPLVLANVAPGCHPRSRSTPAWSGHRPCARWGGGRYPRTSSAPPAPPPSTRSGPPRIPRPSG